MNNYLKFSFFTSSILLFLLRVNAQYIPFYGNLHSHTSYSDGSGTPHQAFTYARDVADLDFLAITDHLEYLTIQPWNWYFTRMTADTFNVPGVFVAIAGYEWGSPIFNHCNVFNTTNLISTTTLLNLSAFYNDVLGERPAFAQFNHPGEEEYSNNWNNFAFYSAPVDSAFPLIELKYPEADTFYRMALDSGWHVGPVANQDNHSPDWGTRNDCRAGVWATVLTREAIFEAIKKRRVFATQDKNAYVWIDLNGSPMGSRVSRARNMPLRILLHDGNGESWNLIQAIGSNGITFLELSSHPATLNTTLIITPTVSRWIYVKARQTDNQWIWSAPVFIEGTPLLAEEKHPLPEKLSIRAHPSPFNSTLRIEIDGIINDDELSLCVHDLSGRFIDRLDYREKAGGIYSAEWAPKTDIPSGLYLIIASMGNSVSIKKVAFLK